MTTITPEVLRDSIREELVTLTFARSAQNILAHWAKPESVRGLIRSLTSNPEWIGDVATRSYLHQNGFDKFVLLADPSFKLRLHIWWPDQIEVIDEHVHNHQWWFASSLLLGRYHVFLYEAAAQGVPMHHYRYASPKGRDHYKMDHLGTAHLECIFDSVFPAGTTYALSPNSLHRVRSIRGALTASLVLQSVHSRPFADVYSEQTISFADEARIPALSPTFVRDRLTAFSDAL